MSASALRKWRGPAGVAIAAVAYGVLVSQQGWWVAILGHLFPTTSGPVFPTATMADLVLRHLAIVGISSAVTIAIGIPLGVWVTRASGRDFRELVAAGVDFGQTFPPVAVLALMMPILGFSIRTAVVALSLYGLFPVVSNTVAGLDAVPPAVLDSARGMGMGKWRILFTVELPLAARVIMAGVRTSVIVNIGTATVAAVAGAGGLGDPIFAGINIQNMGYVFQGAVAAALLAVLADAMLAQVEMLVTPTGSG